MGPRLKRLTAALQLMRIALVFTAISNIWLVVFISRAHLDPVIGAEAIRSLPLWALLLCTGAVATGMYVFGMALNDVMDARRDRVFAPQRPIPSGQFSQRGGIAISVGALLLAIAGSVPLGPMSTMLCLICAALALFYNGLGKHLGGVGIVTLGLIRGVHMFIANPGLAYVWPVWLTMTHVIGISAAAHRLEGKRPMLVGPQVWITVGGWAFVTVAMIAWMNGHHTLGAPGRPWMWVGPTAAAGVFVLMALRLGRQSDTPAAAGRTLMRRGLLWLMVYDAAWLLSDGLWWQAGVMVGLLIAAVLSMRAMVQLKALVEPVKIRSGRKDQVQPSA
ncbi:MAG: hypothetical protein GC162_01320 [Planctomycetes bacterium]|nr:hypothetical protein [Planctomycetota bacterium]